MTTITIELPDEIVASLANAAHKNGETLEQFAADQLQDYAGSLDKVQDSHVYQLIHKIVEDNTELYKRLA